MWSTVRIKRGTFPLVARTEAFHTLQLSEAAIRSSEAAKASFLQRVLLSKVTGLVTLQKRGVLGVGENQSVEFTDKRIQSSSACAGSGPRRVYWLLAL